MLWGGGRRIEKGTQVHENTTQPLCHPMFKPFFIRRWNLARFPTSPTNAANVSFSPITGG